MVSLINNNVMEFVDFIPENRPSERVCDPNIFENTSVVEIDNGQGVAEFFANDLDAYLFARTRLTDMQLAALSSQLSHQNSVFDSLSDEQQVQYLNSRYNQNFAGIDNYRAHLLSNLDKFESDIREFVKSQQDSPDPDPDSVVNPNPE